MSTPAKIKLPYKGLIPYSEEDAEFFFGREREQNFITANLLAERLTLLYGASGVGKSSVLRAGVEHHLKLLAEENLERLGKPKYVVVVFNEWRESDPLRSLLLKVQEAITRTLKGEKIEPVASSLQFTEALLEWSKRARGQLLIILDQFEEYFLYHQDEDGKGTFAEEFPRAIRNLGLPANFLVSFREDAFAKMAFFKLRMPDLFGNYLPIDHLDRDAGRDAIVKPVERYNKQLADDRPPVKVESSLVEEVLKQVETGQVLLGDAGRGMLKREATGGQIETPFLQMVMMRLWEEDAGSGVLRLATLKRLGDEKTNETGAERIVRTHLDKKMDALSPEKQDIAAEVFHYLVTPGGTKIAHTVPDLAEYARLPQGTLAPVLEDLAAGDTRILRGVADKRSEPRYEIFHDVLAAPILDWRTRRVRAQEQAAAARQAEEQRKEVEKQAREEEKSRSAKRLRWAAGILAIMFVFAVGALVLALNRQRAATAEAEKAAESAHRASEAADKAAEAEKVAKKEKENAVEASRKAEDERLEAVKQTGIAQASETKAKREQTRALRNLRAATDSLQVDLDAAKENYDNSLRELSEDCDLREGLNDNLAEFRKLLERFGVLGAEAQKREVQKNMTAITKRLAKLNCAPP